MVDPLSPLYTRGVEYAPRFDGTFWLLTASDVRGFALDETIHRIWLAFDGRTTREAISSVSLELGVSPAFVESAAKVLARTGALAPAQPLDPVVQPLPTVSADLSRLPLVSVIVLASRKARVHLETCLPSIAAQTYPELEVFLVDNQTTDDSSTFTANCFPQVILVPTPRPLGFAAANNLAIKQARGEFLLLINEDVELAPDCVTECVRVALRSDRTAVVAPKMRLFYMRAFINSMGTSVYPDGRSCDNYVGYLDVGQFDDVGQTFAACFGASMLRRSVVDRIGYLDEGYFIYYEDMDWSFRARLQGFQIVAAPRAVVYHKFSATVDTLRSTFKLGLTVRNRLRFVWKNLDFARARWLTRVYRLEDRSNVIRAKQQGRDDVVRVYRRSLRQWLFTWPSLVFARWRTRRSRCRPSVDDEAFALAVGIPEPAIYGRYPIISEAVVRSHYIGLATFRPESQPPLTGPPGIVTSPAKEAGGSLGAKARQALRDKGIRGLLREIRDYIRWLAVSW